MPLPPPSLPAAPPVWGAVLAGGKSERMGCDKARMVIGDEPLGHRQMRLLSGCCARSAAVAPVRPGWLSERDEWVRDSATGAGPVAGILGALEWAREGAVAAHVMILAVDMPRASLGLLTSLREGVRPGRGVVTSGDEGFEPLCACYPAEAFEPLLGRVGAGQNKLQTLVSLLVEDGLMAVRSLSPSEQVDFFNLNTPEDLARLEA
jgi:molybdopterin-guanine dinucleotide biosynthesis protein A